MCGVSARVASYELPRPYPLSGSILRHRESRVNPWVDLTRVKSSDWRKADATMVLYHKTANQLPPFNLRAEVIGRGLRKTPENVFRCSCPIPAWLLGEKLRYVLSDRESLEILCAGHAERIVNRSLMTIPE